MQMSEKQIDFSTFEVEIQINLILLTKKLV